ncbi:MAG TPA: GNAT family N-acetyltransferase [Kofleriaceae bacterium]|nr:GNAT family N-acetyltransferase [Kofleriaceae bacterium]
MRVRSLGLATELALADTRGTVTDRGDCLVVETADDPGYYYGNLLVLPEPPRAGEVAHWRQRFDIELGTNPEIRHVTLVWDVGVEDERTTAELEAAGFTLEHVQVMTASAVARFAVDAEIRLLTPDEVDVELAWAVADRHDESYRRFLSRRASWHRDLVVRGAARFWGAFDGGELVASLGLVDLQAEDATWSGPLGRHARYQDVQTAITHRKRGLASALLSASATDAFARGIASVVIVAEPASDAARVYDRVGFAVFERTVSACLRPVIESPSRSRS